MINGDWQLEKAKKIIQNEPNGPYIEATVEELHSKFLLNLLYYSDQTVVTARHLVESFDLVDKKVNEFCEMCFGGIVENRPEEYITHNGKRYPFVSFLPKIEVNEGL